MSGTTSLRFVNAFLVSPAGPFFETTRTWKIKAAQRHTGQSLAHNRVRQWMQTLPKIVTKLLYVSNVIILTIVILVTFMYCYHCYYLFVVCVLLSLVLLV